MSTASPHSSELLQAFTAELEQLLTQCADLLQQTWCQENARSLFRIFHNIKGTAQLLEFAEIAQAAQLAETLARSEEANCETELKRIHHYLSDALESLHNNTGQKKAYVSSRAEQLINHINRKQALQNSEQLALFSLVGKQLTLLCQADRKQQYLSLNKLSQASKIMDIENMEAWLNELEHQIDTQTINTEKLVANLVLHPRFGQAFQQHIAQESV